ncbi:hypothetical protein ACFM35_05015 [Microbacterium sp. P01]|uniref:hypothetical protein n=1 Tax=Microbacterium sp. P01 TaxID=3366261 RepID=UPI00366B1768
MTITVNERESGIFLTAPNPELIPVPAIAKAWGDTIAAHGALRDARRSAVSLDEEVRLATERAELAATEEQIANGKVPKGLRRAIRTAEDDLEDAKLAVVAAERALLHFATVFRGTIDVHASEWHKLAVAEAESAIGAVTSHRRSIVNANIKLAGALDAITLIERNDGIIAPTGSVATVVVDEALARLTDAIGEGVSDVRRHKNTEVTRG